MAESCVRFRAGSKEGRRTEVIMLEQDRDGFKEAKLL